MKLPEELQKLIRDTRATIKSYIGLIVSPGDRLVWKRGPYKGRVAVVRSVHWDEYEMDIYVFVTTYRKDGRGYVSETAPAHLHGQSLEANFEKTPRQTERKSNGG